jgi:hypothetical protein
MKDTESVRGLMSPDSQHCGDCMLPLVMVGRTQEPVLDENDRNVFRDDGSMVYQATDLYQCPGCGTTRSRPGPRT